VFPARYELNSYIVFRKRLVSKRLIQQSQRGFPLSEALEVILCQHLHHVLRFGLVDLFNALKTWPLELELRFRK
jgi:hypothetical protein